jgi:hypothetical protein
VGFRLRSKRTVLCKCVARHKRATLSALKRRMISCGRPLKLTVRKQQPVHLASALFIVLVIINVIFAPYGTFNFWRLSTLLIYFVLSFFLWRGNRISALIGAIVALAGSLLVGNAVFFLWPVFADQLRHMAGALEVTVSIFGPLLINVAIFVVLVRSLLSNNRWRGT